MKQETEQSAFESDPGFGPVWRWRGRSRKAKPEDPCGGDVVFRYDGACRTASASVWNRGNVWHWIIVEGDGDPQCGSEDCADAAIREVQRSHASAGESGDYRAVTGPTLANIEMLHATALGKGGSLEVQLDRIANSLAFIARDVQALRDLLVAAAKASGFGADLVKEIEDLCSSREGSEKCAAFKGS